MTDVERALWYHLRASRLDGSKFRRQHAISPYVVDFYCDEARLIVEVDGSQHDAGVDATRTSALEGQGMLVLRFWDNQVLTDPDAVLNEIFADRAGSDPHPALRATLSRWERGRAGMNR